MARISSRLAGIAGPLALLLADGCSSKDVLNLTGNDAGMITPDSTPIGGDPWVIDTDAGPPDTSVVAGMVELNTDTIDFGAVVVSSTATRILTVHNPGNDTVRVALSQPAGPDAARFSREISATEVDGTFDLAPGATVEVNVHANAIALGAFGGEMTVDSCFGSCPVTISLLAEGVTTGVRCPEDVDIGPANPGSCLTATVECRNVGNLDETITAVELEPSSDAAFTLMEPALPIRLGAGMSAPFEVDFCPPDPSDKEGELLVLTFDPVQMEHSIKLHGRAGGPDVHCTPAALAFGAVGIGATVTRNLTCTNRGNEDAMVSGMLVGGGAGPVTMTLTPQGPVAPGASAVFTVAINAQVLGMISDTLEVQTNDPDTPALSVPISADVVMIAPCTATLVPSTRDFGLVPIGEIRRQPIAIQNPGNGACLLLDIVLATGSSGFFTIENAPAAGTSIAAGGVATFDAVFRATTAGAAAGTVSVSFSNPSTQPLDADLTATAGNTSLSIEPPVVDFGSRPVGCATPHVLPVTIRGLAGQPRIASIQIVRGSTASFSLARLPMLPRTVARNETVSFDVVFDPQAAGAHAVEIHVAIMGQMVPLIVVASGQGAPNANRTDSFNYASPTIDLLLVVDDSCSMGPAQMAFSDGVPGLVQRLGARAADYHIAVVTTDMRSMMRSGRMSGSPAVLDTMFGGLEAELQTRVTPGTGGNGSQESGVAAMAAALTPPLSTSDNAGFIRAGADLGIIVLSDEDDQSAVPPSIEEVTNTLRGLAGQGSGELSVSAIVGPATGGCQSAHGNGAAAPRYHELVARARNGIARSYCDDIGASIAAIADHVLGAPSFTLTAAPLESTLTVRVNGMPVPAAAWTFDAGTRKLTFAQGMEPANGSRIDVSYDTFCLSATCGNGMTEMFEQCDDANMDDTDACVNGCRNATCGDGFVRQGVEPCDDGNTSNTDACVAGCVAAVCGDGFVQAGTEECDDGNTMSGDACPATCRFDLTGFYTVAGPTAAAFSLLANPNPLMFMDNDDGLRTVPLPFAFNFFGVSTSTLTVSVNGAVTTEATFPNNWENRDFPDATPPDGIIAVWWDDLFIDNRVMGSGVSTGVLGNAPNRQLVIQWRNVRPIGHNTNNHRRFNFQLVLNEGTNVIELRYGDTLTSGGVPSESSASAGIENQSATSGADVLGGCSPMCDGRPRPGRPDGYPQNTVVVLTP